MRKNIKALIISVVTFVGLVVIIYFSTNHFTSLKPRKKSITPCDCNRATEATAPVSPTTVLDDKNDIHLLHAQANGLSKVYSSNLEFEEDSAKLVKEGTLVHIKNNPLYHVKELKHSYPFLVPATDLLLKEVGALFNENLPEKKKNNFIILITSALRTGETQINLSKHNRNASPTSAHLFGTTIDISYKDFYSVEKDTFVSDYDAVQALYKAMEQLRYECKLVTVKERKQSCFHTTAVVCRPITVEE